MSNRFSKEFDSESDSFNDFSEDSMSSFGRFQKENSKIILNPTSVLDPINLLYNSYQMMGKQFSSFNQIKSFISEIKTKTGFNFIIQRSETIISKLKKSNTIGANLNTCQIENLKYYSIKFCCELGEEHKNTNNNILSTKKLGFPSFIKFLLKNNYLIITDLNNEHLNHHNISFNNIEYSKNEVDMLSCFKAIGSIVIRCPS